MAKRRVDEVLGRALVTDPTETPVVRYDLVLPDGTVVAANAELRLKNPITTPGMFQDKVAWDECLAASGVTTGTASALLLDQPGFVLFDGAPVRFKLHIALDPNPNVTMNVNGTGAIPIKTTRGSPPRGMGSNDWVIAIYNLAKNEYTLQGGWSQEHQGTLTSGNWVGDQPPYTQIVNIPGLPENARGTIGLAMTATAEQRDAARAAGISPIATAAGTVTLVADNDKPIVDIPITILEVD